MSKSAMKMGLKFSESQLKFVRRLSETSDGQFLMARGFWKLPMSCFLWREAFGNFRWVVFYGERLSETSDGLFTQYIGGCENRLTNRLSV